MCQRGKERGKRIEGVRWEGLLAHGRVGLTSFLIMPETVCVNMCMHVSSANACEFVGVSINS